MSTSITNSLDALILRTQKTQSIDPIVMSGVRTFSTVSTPAWFIVSTLFATPNNVSNIDGYAQQFTMQRSTTINRIYMQNKVQGTGASYHIDITSSLGGTPIGSSDTWTGGAIYFIFSTPVVLTVGNTYYFELYRNGTAGSSNLSNYYQFYQVAHDDLYTTLAAGSGQGNYLLDSAHSLKNGVWSTLGSGSTSIGGFAFEISTDDSVQIDALKVQTKTKTNSIDAKVTGRTTKTYSLTVDLKQTESLTTSIDVSIVSRHTVTQSVDVKTFAPTVETYALDASIEQTFTTTHDIDSKLTLTRPVTYLLDVDLFATPSKTYSLDVSVKETFSKTYSLDASLKLVGTKTHAIDIDLDKSGARTHAVDMMAFKPRLLTYQATVMVASPMVKNYALDVSISAARRTYDLTSALKKKLSSFSRVDAAIDTTTKLEAYSLDAYLVDDLHTAISISQALYSATLWPTAKILRVISQNMNVAASISTGDEISSQLSSNRDESLVDGYDRPSMRFAICDGDATTNDSYRIFPSITDPEGDQYADYQKIPWISSQVTTDTGIFSSPLVFTATYPFYSSLVSPLQCNKLEIVVDPTGKGSAGILTDVTVEICIDGTNYITAYSSLDAFDCDEPYRSTLYLQTDNTTWGLTRADVIPDGLNIYGIQITVNSISINATEIVAKRPRPLIIYEINALREEDLTGDVVSFTTDEQRDLTTQTLSPIGSSSANTLSMTLSNTPTSLYSPVFTYTGFESTPSSVKDIDSMIIVQLGVKLSDSVTYFFNYGKYIVDDWNLSADLGQIEVRARDYSRYLQDGKMASMIYEDYTLHEVLRDVIERAGIFNYEIDTSIFSHEELATGVIREFVSADEVADILKNNVIWTDGQTYWDFMHSIAFTDLGVFYFDRDNVFHYKTKEEFTDTTRSEFVITDILTEQNDIYSAGTQIQLMKNNITLQYTVQEMSDNTVGLWDSTDTVTVSSTSLAASIDSASDTILVGDISDWEKQGYFKIDDEIVKYQNRTDTAFEDCERGYLGTKPAYHYVTVDTAKWTFNGGDWTMNGGVLEATGQGNAWGTAITADPIAGHAYTIGGKIRITEAPYKAGIITKSGNAANKYYYFVLKSVAAPGDTNGVTGDDLTSLYEMWVYDNGDTTKLKSSQGSKHQILTDLWWDFKVQIDDDEFSLFVEGTRVLTYKVKDTDVNIDYPAKVGFISRGKGPNQFDNFIITKLADSVQGEDIIIQDGFGAPIYQIARFDAEFETTPARSVQYMLSNNTQVEVIDFQPGPYRATAYVLNKRDAISIVSGSIDTSANSLQEYFYIIGFAADHKTTETLTKANNKSIAKYGSQELNLTLPWIQSESQAKGVLAYLIECYKEPVFVFTVQIAPRPGLEIGQMIGITPEGLLFEGLEDSGGGVEREFHIIGINTAFSEQGLVQTLTLRAKSHATLIPVVNNVFGSCSIAIPPNDWYTTKDNTLSHSMIYNGYTETIYTDLNSPVTDADGFKVPIKVWRPSNTGGGISGGIMAPTGSAAGGSFKTLIWAHEGFQSRYTESSDSEDIKRWLTKIVRTGYNVIFVDYRGSGGYTRSYFEAFSYLNKDVDDLKAVRDWAATQGFVNPLKIILSGFSHGASMTYTAIQLYPTDFAGFMPICGTPDMGCAVQRGNIPQKIKDKIYISMGGPPDGNANLWIDNSPDASFDPLTFTVKPILALAGELDSFYDIKDVYSLDTKANEASFPFTTYAYKDQQRGWLFADDGADSSKNFQSDPWLKIIRWLGAI